jgi:integrase
MIWLGLKKANVRTEKGVGFYMLRRTAGALTASSGDPFAVQRLLGHADLKMTTTYVRDVSEQTDSAINNTPKLIVYYLITFEYVGTAFLT